jgi:Uncharacterised nucleotidyltransferase
MSPIRDSSGDLELLSQLLLCRDTSLADSVAGGPSARALDYEGRTLDAIYRLSIVDIQQLHKLANSNHVLVRTFRPLRDILVQAGKSEEAQYVLQALNAESARIENALASLHDICTTLEGEGCPVTVIKSLDHWPDLGSDLDLYTGADARRIVEVMKTTFGATVADRSWGDRLANKWNFAVPGLPELVEVHAGRLGQTGEQTAVTLSVAARSRWVDIGGYTFRVAAPEDRLVISTLQRMYRHFYIRLCDVVDNATLVEARSIDFDYLCTLGNRAGLWNGIASYLVLISQYVEAYRGYGLELPTRVRESARIKVTEITFRREFLRVPILPHSMALFASELKNLLLQGDIRNSLRLSLMPGLATAAVVEQKITGSDKGIW